jgi:hypothetical protein
LCIQKKPGPDIFRELTKKSSGNKIFGMMIMEVILPIVEPVGLGSQFLCGDKIEDGDSERSLGQIRNL